MENKSKKVALKTVGYINLDEKNRPIATKSKNKEKQVKVYKTKSTAKSVKTRLEKKAAEKKQKELQARLKKAAKRLNNRL